MQFVALPEPGKARIGHLDRLEKIALHHQHPPIHAIAAFYQKRLGGGIAAEEPGRVAAAVEAEVERTAGRPLLAGAEDLGPALPQILSRNAGSSSEPMPRRRNAGRTPSMQTTPR